MKRYTQAAITAVVCSACFAAILAYGGYDMGLLNRIFGKRAAETEKKEGGLTNLAFILLSEERLPDVEGIERAFHDFTEPGGNIQGEANDTGEETIEKVISLKLNTGETSFVALMPAPVPDGEADQGAQFSLSSFKDGAKFPLHHAHLLVTFHAAADTPPIAALSRFTSVVAAVTKASHAVGVYWGNAGATHESDFFMSVAGDQGVVPRIMLWSGVSVAREADGRLSLLSTGMEQLNLPDLLLVAGDSSAGDAIETLYDLLAYVAERGEPLPEGDTVGRTDDERLPVHYVKSPVEPTKKVWRVELP